MQKMIKPSLIAASIVLAISSQQAGATNGYAAHGFGTVQKAMGGTAVAGSDNAMNIATNPASMSMGENNWTGGLELFVPDRGLEHKGRPGHPNIPISSIFPPGATGNWAPGDVIASDSGIDGKVLRANEKKNFISPEGAYQKHIGKKFAVGVAVYGNGGMNASYDRPIFSQSNKTSINLEQLFIAPSASMKINPRHSIGASLNLVYQRIDIKGVDAFKPFSRDPNSLSDKGTDSSTGLGFSIGWQGKVLDRLTLGATYRSKASMGKFKKYKGLFAEQGKFDVPSMITIGASMKATPKTTVALDIARINYTDSKSISNKNNTAGLQQQLVAQQFGVIPPGTALQGPMLGDDDGAGFGWEDQTVVKVGVKHKLNNKITLLGGYNHGKSPITTDQTAFNVLAPATTEDHMTLGAEYQLTKKSRISAQYMHAFLTTIKGDTAREANGQPVSPGSQIGIGPNPLTDFSAADIEMSQDAFGLSYTRSF
jgi:long-chain fatty acid transport protein